MISKSIIPPKKPKCSILPLNVGDETNPSTPSLMNDAKFEEYRLKYPNTHFPTTLEEYRAIISKSNIPPKKPKRPNLSLNVGDETNPIPEPPMNPATLEEYMSRYPNTNFPTSLEEYKAMISKSNIPPKKPKHPNLPLNIVDETNPLPEPPTNPATLEEYRSRYPHTDFPATLEEYRAMHSNPTIPLNNPKRPNLELNVTDVSNPLPPATLEEYRSRYPNTHFPATMEEYKAMHSNSNIPSNNSKRPKLPLYVFDG